DCRWNPLSCLLKLSPVRDWPRKHGISIWKRDHALYTNCLAGLKASIGGSFYVGQTTFLAGWVATTFQSAISLRKPLSRFIFSRSKLPPSLLDVARRP